MLFVCFRGRGVDCWPCIWRCALLEQFVWGCAEVERAGVDAFKARAPPAEGARTCACWMRTSRSARAQLVLPAVPCLVAAPPAHPAGVVPPSPAHLPPPLCAGPREGLHHPLVRALQRAPGGCPAGGGGHAPGCGQALCGDVAGSQRRRRCFAQRRPNPRLPSSFALQRLPSSPLLVSPPALCRASASWRIHAASTWPSRAPSEQQGRWPRGRGGATTKRGV